MPSVGDWIETVLNFGAVTYNQLDVITAPARNPEFSKCTSHSAGLFEIRVPRCLEPFHSTNTRVALPFPFRTNFNLRSSAAVGPGMKLVSLVGKISSLPYPRTETKRWSPASSALCDILSVGPIRISLKSQVHRYCPT